MEALPNHPLRYGYTMDIQKAETINMHESCREETWSTPGISGYMHVLCAQGGGRLCGRMQRTVARSTLQPGRRTTKQSETLNCTFVKQGTRTHGQKIG